MPLPPQSKGGAPYILGIGGFEPSVAQLPLPLQEFLPSAPCPLQAFCPLQACLGFSGSVAKEAVPAMALGTAALAPERCPAIGLAWLMVAVPPRRTGTAAVRHMHCL